ncbi:MAG TPA: hypothetical protein VFU86_15410 [Terriglobales bacterium]|nr:hypothetical protein [Terriglobales bacterium]
MRVPRTKPVPHVCRIQQTWAPRTHAIPTSHELRLSLFADAGLRMTIIANGEWWDIANILHQPIAEC